MFTYHLPTKIIFGQPALLVLQAELDMLEAQQVLLVSDPGLVDIGQVERIQAGLSTNGRVIIPFTEVSSNPTSTEVAAGLALALDLPAQAIIALGGGSAIDVGKAIAMLMTNGGRYSDYQWGGKDVVKRSLPLLAVPTTAGTGSEVSKVAVIVDPADPFKKGVLSPNMFPYAAIIDPELTRSMPGWLTAATGMDAWIHALEAFVGNQTGPYTDRFALAALETAWPSLPEAVDDGDNMTARTQMMLAALWGGTAMDHAGLGLIHSLSGPLTAHLHLHHGLANALILPYAMRFNIPAIPDERLQRLTMALGLNSTFSSDGLPEALFRYVKRIGLPTHLTELDRPLQAIDWAAIAEETTRMVLIQNNPRPVTISDVEEILRQMRE